MLWQARFVSPRIGDPPTATLQNVFRYEGVARTINGACPDEFYTFSALPPARVLELLTIWNSILSRRQTEFGCVDHSSSELCDNNRHIRDDLAAKWVAGIAEEEGMVALTLNIPLIDAPAQVYTTVKFDVLGKGPVSVIREVPAPF